MRRLIWTWVLLGFTLLLILNSPPVLRAQADCGRVDQIVFPVDQSRFTLVQAFGAPSVRHQGRFHTGEDWYGGRGTTAGLPVVAAANGRVTYSYDLGWGRDGGVVIIEHRFNDGTVAYTQYGHIRPGVDQPLPPRLSCVTAGAVIGFIADVRPAPHLHFEVRTGAPDLPGPGYSREDPSTLVYLPPSQFLVNQAAWLSPAYRWHIDLGDGPQALHGPFALPYTLSDSSVLYLDVPGTTLRRATPDGRILWRTRLDRPAVGVFGFQGASWLIFSDGAFQIVNLDGTLGERWRVDAALAGAPLSVAGLLVFPQQGGGLIAIDPARRQLAWASADAPDFVHTFVSSDGPEALLALLTEAHELWLFNARGEFISRTQLREGASFARVSDDSSAMRVYARGGLFIVDAEGRWALEDETAPRGGQHSAIHIAADGRRFLFDGETLHAYSPDRSLLWVTRIGPLQGRVEMTELEGTLLLLSGGGTLAVIGGTGVFCNRLDLYGDEAARIWVQLGVDGLLRFAIGDHLAALDWVRFKRAC